MAMATPSTDVDAVHQLLKEELGGIDSRNPESLITFDHSRQLGWGSYGDVYLGEYLGMSVCVKLLKGVQVTDTELWKKFLRRLTREMKIWRDLLHPNVVLFLGWTSEVHNNYVRVALISGWCNGKNVKEYLGQHPDADRRHLVCDVSKGLEYLHSRDIIHGDVKPANVVITLGPPPIALLCDFGLSSILNDITTYAQGTSTASTLRFASPELLQGYLDHRDKGSDVWAFGCTSAEIMRDLQPYSWLSMDMQVPSAVARSPPYEWNNPDAFERAISSCMAYHPDDRPSTGELSRCLDQQVSFVNFSYDTQQQHEGGHLEAPLQPSSPVSFPILLPASPLAVPLATLQTILSLRKLEDLPLGWRYRENQDIPELRVRFDQVVVPHVQRACRDWCDVICGLNHAERDVLDSLFQVVPVLLHWVAAMGIMDEIDVALRGMYCLEEWLENDQLKAYLGDFYRMTLQSRVTISKCSLSVLGGSHPFVPRNSMLNSLISPDVGVRLRAQLIGNSVNSDESWDPCIIKLPSYASAVHFSPDSRRLVWGSDYGRLHILDVATSSVPISCEGHSGKIYTISFSPNGLYVASTSKDKWARIWTLTDGARYHTLRTRGVPKVVFSPDNRHVVSSTRNGDILLWDILNRGTSVPIKNDAKHVASITFSSEGRFVGWISGKFLQIWNTATRTASALFRGHTRTIDCMAFSPTDEYLIATGSRDNSVRLWDAATGVTLHVLEHSDSPTSILFSPNGNRLATSSGEGVRLYSPPHAIHTILVHADACGLIAFSANGQNLAIRSEDAIVRILDAESKAERVISLQGQPEIISYAPCGRFLAFTSKNDFLRIWSTLAAGLSTPLNESHTQEIFTVSFSPNGRLLASGSADTTVRIWNVNTRTSFVLRKGIGAVYAVHFSPDGRSLAVGDSSTVEIWDVMEWKLILSFRGQNAGISSVAFSPDGQWVASTSNSYIMVWNAVNGTVRFTLDPKKSEYMHSSIFSPTGRFLASKSWHRVRIWDLESGECVRERQGFKPYGTLTFSEDGRLLLLRTRDTVQFLHGDTLEDATPPQRWRPAFSVLPLPFPVFLGEHSLYLKQKEAHLHFCWFPDRPISYRIPYIEQSGNIICVVGEYGKLAFVDVAKLELPDCD